MNLFETLFTQPIFNLLLFLYGVIPGQDLGIAVIVFTVVVRTLMWPLVKKQLHQGKLMRDLQPQLATVKKKAKGNKQLEAQMMMELYKEKGVSPFGSIGLLLVQIPFFIALYSSINIIATNPGDIPRLTYEFLRNIPVVNSVITNPESLNTTLFGFIDLTKSALSATGWAAVVLFVLAIATGVVQFYQSKQLMPQPKDRKRLRDMLKDQAAGKQVDQADMMAATMSRTIYLIPGVMFFACIFVAGALELYLLTQTVTGFIQQQFVLGKDTEELEDIAEEAPAKAAETTTRKPGKKTAAQRSKSAQSAKVVKKPKKKK